MMILLVEDDIKIAKFVGREMRPAGFAVARAGNDVPAKPSAELRKNHFLRIPGSGFRDGSRL